MSLSVAACSSLALSRVHSHLMAMPVLLFVTAKHVIAVHACVLAFPQNTSLLLVCAAARAAAQVAKSSTDATMATLSSSANAEYGAKVSTCVSK